MIDVRVAIVTHNSGLDIANCLDSLTSQHAALHVYVADNASSDDTVAKIRAKVPHDRVLLSNENVGFARAVNSICRDLSGMDYVLLLNPDVTLRPTTIDALIGLARSRPQAGLYGGLMLGSDGLTNPACCLGRPTIWQALSFGLGLSSIKSLALLNPDTLGGWNRRGTREVPVLTAGVLLIDAQLWGEQCGLDEGFVHNGEDVDLCLRAGALGARPTFSDEAVYVHAAGSSSASQSDRQASILRGKLTLYRHHLSPLGYSVARAFTYGGAALRALLEPLFRGRSDTWRSVWKRRMAWKDGWSASTRELRTGSQL